MRRYKTQWCPLPGVHDWDACMYAHTKRDIRRTPTAAYGTRKCPDWETALATVPKDCCPNMPYEACCPRGVGCHMAHGIKEVLYHPAVYRAKLCSNANTCRGMKRRHCAFAHCTKELRDPVKTAFQTKMVGTWAVNREQPQFFVPLTFVSFRDTLPKSAQTVPPARWPQALKEPALQDALFQKPAQPPPRTPSSHALKEAAFQEAAQHWLAKLFRREATPPQILESTCKGAAVLLNVCSYIFVELDVWLNSAASNAPIDAGLQDRVDIATSFLLELVKSGMLDDSAQVATMKCVEYIMASSGSSGEVDASWTLIQDALESGNPTISRSEKKGSVLGCHNDVLQWHEMPKWQQGDYAVSF